MLRLRTDRHDPKTPAQIACRAPMAFGRPAYYSLPQAVIDQWNDVDPMDFFCEAVKRWLAGHSPATSPYFPVDTESEITVTATATATASGILIQFTPSDDYALWGIAIIRSLQEITQPDPYTLRVIFHHTTTATALWIDCPKKPATYHYRLAACENTGKLGAFSPDISATIP